MLNSQQEHVNNICIGIITAVNGVKGYVKVRSFTAAPEDVASFQHVFDDYGRSYELSIVTLKKDYVIASIKGIESRNEAEKFRNTKLYITRSSLPEVGDDDEYYHADLVGAEVFLQDGTRFGTVKNVVNFGAGDILEVYDHSSERAVYYPFNKQHVPQVDLAQRRIELCIHEEVLAASE